MAETGRDERLIHRFDYDGDYGTVLNRFLMQQLSAIRSPFMAPAARPGRLSISRTPCAASSLRSRTHPSTATRPA